MEKFIENYAFFVLIIVKNKTFFWKHLGAYKERHNEGKLQPCLISNENCVCIMSVCNLQYGVANTFGAC